MLWCRVGVRSGVPGLAPPWRGVFRAFLVACGQPSFLCQVARIPLLRVCCLLFVHEPLIGTCVASTFCCCELCCSEHEYTDIIQFFCETVIPSGNFLLVQGLGFSFPLQGPGQGTKIL